MPILRIPVECFRCRAVVEQTSAVIVSKRENKHECYTCYQKNRSSTWSVSQTAKRTVLLLCERCHYKFKSKKLLCPYCDKNDMLMNPNTKLKDLI
jgi:hypothetical protein